MNLRCRDVKVTAVGPTQSKALGSRSSPTAPDTAESKDGERAEHACDDPTCVNRHRTNQRTELGQ